MSMARGAGAATPADDIALPFAVEALDVRGRVVRLGGVMTQLIEGHRYPEPVARQVAEAVALTVLLGTSVKIDGRFQLQTRSDGPIDMIVVDLDTPNGLRAFARFDAGRLEGVPADGLLGKGHLAFTIEQKSVEARYQGIVALEGQGLEAAAHQYFRQSEQIPTALKLAAAEVVDPGGARHWRAAGLMAQFLPAAGERIAHVDLDPGDAPAGTPKPDVQEDDAWTEARSLVATVEDHELIDPTLSAEGLLYRLFHERGVRVFEPVALEHRCRCSRRRIVAMLRQFTPQERIEMREPEGGLSVKCEFCGTSHRFSDDDIDRGED